MEWFWRIYERYPNATARVTAHIVTFAIVFALVMAITQWYDRVYAAPPQPDTVPVSDNCTLDSTIGILDVYQCTSQEGAEYMVNSFGFMFPIK